MGTGARGRGYLQVRADSPQDIVDAVAGDQRHEDVLKNREKMREKKVGEVSNHPKPNPSSKKTISAARGLLEHRFSKDRARQRRPALESSPSQLRPPALPQVFISLSFSPLLFLLPAKTRSSFFRASLARLLSPRALSRTWWRRTGSGATESIPQPAARSNTQSPRDARRSQDGCKGQMDLNAQILPCATPC